MLYNIPINMSSSTGCSSHIILYDSTLTTARAVRKPRVIDVLRRKFPGKWTYSWEGYHSWRHEDGRRIERHARAEDEDGLCHLEYWMYGPAANSQPQYVCMWS